ncbi:hypothetical protein GT755_34465 [Herbidospora sp. NEAU-GS84]|uniref:Uncharacterized protein n=1 Tax=Herbidospora solisilvae TaxID=2696284 RepID=A0A7C9JGL2_9ACTN|nr:hypothetical protein [Herbidospora solisilvae]NAS26764.1 hypothetical protein [Herbidospora solisilvae]
MTLPLGLPATRTAGSLFALTTLVAVAGAVWPGRLDFLAWALMGVVAGFSLSGSV